jgi:hypothetical protein
MGSGRAFQQALAVRRRSAIKNDKVAEMRGHLVQVMVQLILTCGRVAAGIGRPRRAAWSNNSIAFCFSGV